MSADVKDSQWMIPFFTILVGSLIFFLWQVASYTTVLG